MSRGTREDSQVGRIVATMKVGVIESGRQIAERMSLEYGVVHAALTQRAKFVKDIVRMPEGFIRVQVVPAAPSRGEASRSVRVARDAAIRARASKGRPVEIAAPRVPPPFREWRPGRSQGPIRPGADDHRAIPSLYGDVRVAYKGAEPRSAGK